MKERIFLSSVYYVGINYVLVQSIERWPMSIVYFMRFSSHGLLSKSNQLSLLFAQSANGTISLIPN